MPPKKRPGGIHQIFKQYLEDGSFVQLLENSESKFMKVVGKLGGLEEGDRVRLLTDSSCIGTIKWIGCKRQGSPSATVDTSSFILGVKLNQSSKKHADCGYGELASESLVSTARPDVLFGYFHEWAAVTKESPAPDGKPALGISTSRNDHKAPSTGSSKGQAAALHFPAGGRSRFEKIHPDLSLNGYTIGSKVVVDGLIGTVGWIGCRAKEQTKVKDYIVGVVLDSTPSWNWHVTDGSYDGERLINSTKKNVMFTRLKNVSHAGDIGKTSRVPVTKIEPEYSTQKTADGLLMDTCHHADSKFDEVIGGDLVELHDVKVYVQLHGKIWSGTVKWIGCYYNHACNTQKEDLMVGVKLDKPRNERYPEGLTNGFYETEQLVQSSKKDVIFTKLKFCTIDKPLVTETGNDTSSGKEGLGQTTAGKVGVQIVHHPDSHFDEIVGDGIRGIAKDARVYLRSDKRRSGTVKWIGCYHNQASQIPESDFIVGVKLDRPQLETSGLTNGYYDGEVVVKSSKKDVKFVKLEFCSLENTPIQGTRPVDRNRPTAQTTVTGLQIETRHIHRSRYDEVVGDGLAGVSKGMRVYLHGDKRRSGTVKWIGCLHNRASETPEPDFIVGVQLDRPEDETFPERLTYGIYEEEQLVISSTKDIKFVLFQQCSLSAAPDKESDKGPTAQTTVTGLQIEIRHLLGSRYDEVVGDGLAGIAKGMRVHLHSDKKRSGTVKWIGCLHNRASETPEPDFIVGVQLDRLEDETFPETLTDGFYEGEHLVTSSRKDIKFVTFQHCSLSAAPDKKADREQKVTTADGLVIETYHSPHSKYDQVVAGDLSGFASDARVYLHSDARRSGTVKWIGCLHNQACDTFQRDFVVGLKLDRPENEEFPEGLTNGQHEGEQLVQSSTNDMKFVKLQYCSLAAAPTKDTRPAEHAERAIQTTASGLQIEIYHLLGSSYDEVVGDGLAGLAKGMRVYLHGDKKRSGTVKWIGCYHKQASKTLEPDFKVGVQLDKPDQETFPEKLTDGLLNGEDLVFSSKKYIKFVQLKHCSRLRAPATESHSGGAEYDGYRDSPPRSLTAAEIRNNLAKSKDDEMARNREQHRPTLNHHCSDSARPSEGSLDSAAAVPSQPTQETDAYRQPSHGKLLRQRSQEMQPGKPHSVDFISVPNSVLQKLKSTSTYKPAEESINNSGIPHVDVRRTIESKMLQFQSKEENSWKSSPFSSQAYRDGRVTDVNKPLPMEVDHFSLQDNQPVPNPGWPTEEIDEGILLKGQVQKQDDNTYFTAITPVKQSERALVNDSSFGVPLKEVVSEYVLPPTHPNQYTDRWKGVQGDLNSCYMDSSMFAMFSYLTIFDNILFRPKDQPSKQNDENFERTESIREVLRTRIVAPLRKYGLAQKNGMHELRRLLAEWGLVSGLTEDEKDPEEFLNLLLVNTFATPSPIVLSNGQESHLFHLLAEKEEAVKFPTVQELLERTCLQEKFKFKKIPPYLILHYPRFGKAYRMYDQIMPSTELDITDLLTGAHQACYICGEDASFECYGCYKDRFEIPKSCFCSGCVDDFHQAKPRQDHKPVLLEKTGSTGQQSSAKSVLKLAAVLCIETSHYVAFVASDTTANARWYFFDSMADREGTTNIPEVKEIPDFRKLLSEVTASNIASVSPYLRRLVRDGYICFYANPDLPQYNAIDVPLLTTLPSGTTGL